MSKRLQITPQLRARMAAVFGEDVDPAAYAIYETIALNTLPITQRGSLFDGAVVSEGTLYEMAAFMQSGEGVPLIAMHDREMLPVGKVFNAEIYRDKEGRPELRAQFAVSLSEDKIIAKIDDGTIPEVSMGFLSKELRCSKCNFDYLGKDADLFNVWEMTCNEGHTIGQDGVHLNVIGLDQWYELSLVGKGAASGAKILKPVEGEGAAIAASGLSRGALILQLSATKEAPAMPDPIPVDLGQLTGIATELVSAKTELATTTAKVAELTTQLTAAQAQVAELTTQLDTAKKAGDEQAAAALSFLKDEAKALNVALGQADAAVPEDVAGLMAAIKDGRAKLASLIPTGGVSDRSDSLGATATLSTAAFRRTPR